MYFRYLITSIVTLILLSMGGVKMTAATSYTPAHFIVMTGSQMGTPATGRIRWDLAPYLVGAESLIPRLDTTTLTFTGSWYMESVGWVATDLGPTKRISLDCGAQSLSSLSTPCHLTGTGYSNEVGDIVFALSGSGRVDYLPSTGTLSGSAWSPAIGSIPLDEIILPLRPARLAGVETIRADDMASLSISGADLYGYTSTGWTLDIHPTLAPTLASLVTGDSGGNFSSVDLSIADMYDYTIIDPSGSQTIDQMRVFAGTASMSLKSGSYQLKDICNGGSPILSLCPDGSVHPTTFSGGLGKNTHTIDLADGLHSLDLQILLRDRYGNPLSTSSESNLQYTLSLLHTPKRCQVFTENSSLCASDWMTNNEALSVKDELNTDLPNLAGLLQWTTSTNPTTTIRLSSLAPTKTLEIASLKYTYTTTSGISLDSSKVIPLSSMNRYPQFLGVYSMTDPSIDTMTMSDTMTLTDTISMNPTTATLTNQQIVRGLTIGVGNTPSSYLIPDTAPCSGYISHYPVSGLCSWSGTLSGRDKPSLQGDTLSVGGSGTTWVLTGGTLGSSISEIRYTPVFSYDISGKKVVYMGDDRILSTAPATTAPRVKVIGSVGLSRSSLGAPDSMSRGGEITVEMRNQLKKTISLLSRSRTDYSDVDYLIISGSDVRTSLLDLSTKRSIMVIGGDIIIDQDILPSTLVRSLITLSDESGNGGHIIIESGVTTIASSLFSDRNIVSGTKSGGVITTYPSSSKTSQLYIQGTVMTQNTLDGDHCPSLIPECTSMNQVQYGLADLRSNYAVGNPTANTPTALANSGSAIVIEYDPRVLFQGVRSAQ